MTTYLAVVKYGVNDTDAQKVTALRDGILECGLRLVEEFGVPFEDVERWLDDALNELQWAADEAAS